VNFDFADEGVRAKSQDTASAAGLPVYRSTTNNSTGDIWKPLQNDLLALPGRVERMTLAQLPSDLRKHLTTASLTQLQMSQSGVSKQEYEQFVLAYMAGLRKANWVIPIGRSAGECGGKNRINARGSNPGYSQNFFSATGRGSQGAHPRAGSGRFSPESSTQSRGDDAGGGETDPRIRQ